MKISICDEDEHMKSSGGYGFAHRAKDPSMGGARLRRRRAQRLRRTVSVRGRERGVGRNAPAGRRPPGRTRRSIGDGSAGRLTRETVLSLRLPSGRRHQERLSLFDQTITVHGQEIHCKVVVGRRSARDTTRESFRRDTRMRWRITHDGNSKRVGRDCHTGNTPELCRLPFLNPSTRS